MTSARNAVVALAVAIVLVACHKKDAGSCRTDAAQLTDMVGHLDHAPARLKLGTMPLVDRADLPPLTKLEVPVVIVQGSVRVRGREVATTETGHELDLEGKAGTPEGNGRTYTLAVAPGEPWSRVVDVIDSAKQVGFDHVQLVFANATRPRTAPPIRTSIDDELDQLVPPGASTDAAAATMANLAVRTVVRCPDLAVAFSEAFHAVEPTDEITSHLTGALLACNCDVDLGQLRSLLYRLYTSVPPVSMLALVVDDAAQPVELPATASWRDASQAFTMDATLSPRASR